MYTKSRMVVARDGEKGEMGSFGLMEEFLLCKVEVLWE